MTRAVIVGPRAILVGPRGQINLSSLAGWGGCLREDLKHVTQPGGTKVRCDKLS